MTQTLTTRVKAIKNTPGTGELVQVSEFNSAFDKFDNHFVPACKLRNSIAQSIPHNVGTFLQYDTVALDTYAGRTDGPMADLVNDQIIIQRDGLYFVKANIWTLTVSATGVMRLDITVNGGIQQTVLEQAVATTNTQGIRDFLNLSVGDLVKIKATQTSGAARSYGDNTIPGGFEFGVVWYGAGVEV
jgi:hypothetical protein